VVRPLDPRFFTASSPVLAWGPRRRSFFVAHGNTGFLKAAGNIERVTVTLPGTTRIALIRALIGSRPTRRTSQPCRNRKRPRKIKLVVRPKLSTASAGSSQAPTDFLIAALLERDVDVAFEQNGSRITDFRRGWSLGARDHIMF